MIVAYDWKLNGELLLSGAVQPLDAILSHQLPGLVAAHDDFIAIHEHWSIDLCWNAADAERVTAGETESSEDPLQSARHYRWAAAYLERFDGSDELAFSADCYERAAQQEMRGGSPVTAVSLLRQVAAIRDRLNADEHRKSPQTNRHLALLRAAVSQDDANLQQIRELAKRPICPARLATPAVDYLLLKPTPGRLRLSRSIIDHVEGDESDRTFLAARWSAAAGDLRAAVETIDSAKDLGDQQAQAFGLRGQWQLFLDGYGIDAARPVFEHPRDNKQLTVAARVNRGFSLLANAVYFEALAWFMSALHLAKSDPFARFGYALATWRMDMFGVAARSAQETQNALSHYPLEYRELSFTRADPTSEPRHYHGDPVYPIFNVKECLARIERCENFVRHEILP